tara:strand:- start:11573 stop:11899 length:327 start_codon:yes stop_codon:yes gene_type:complete
MGILSNERLIKQPTETRKFAMEFNSLLGTGETVSSITSAASEKIDGSTTDLTIASPTIETSTVSSKDSLVSFWVSGGTTGNTYKIEVLVTTSSSAILEGDGILFVTDR